MSPKLPFLDNLRTFCVIILFCCAAVIGYGVMTPHHTFVAMPAAERSGAVSLAAYFLFLLAVPCLFFISGYCTAASLRVRLFRPFLQRRLHRIGLPWLAGAVVIAPILAYISALSRQSDVAPLTFLTTSFFGPAYEQGHYWFLGLLCLCTLVLTAAKKLRRNILRRVPGQRLLPLYVIPLFLLLHSAGTLLIWYVLPGFYGNVIEQMYTLAVTPYLLLSSCLYFALGVYAMKHRWFTAQGYTPSLPWLVLLLLALVLYRSDWHFFFLVGFGLPITDVFISLTGLFSLLAIFARFAGKTSPSTEKLALFAYPLYYLGNACLQLLAYFLLPLTVGPVLKVTLAIVLTLVYVYFLANYLLFRLTCFQRR
ncbi:acyltransferase family protein [Megasphaera vaginalis (ex Srinivasan et al. 2021)]|uniref:Acyltransferase n=1 Tax=Megasphaera vaginalis (ex Srinivasan et al. 2021) TaxID=1111454 RepID=U7UIJ6_9FIRM|nr:acyltransferase family protein [Megasphaera vaginalis (ex Srinivasan et al. 2021)]ERT59242.1 acyltransferase [Megasphaera vaginalis (ex Srinivasan et al. 2021)]